MLFLLPALAENAEIDTVATTTAIAETGIIGELGFAGDFFTLTFNVGIGDTVTAATTLGGIAEGETTTTLIVGVNKEER